MIQIKLEKRNFQSLLLFFLLFFLHRFSFTTVTIRSDHFKRRRFSNWQRFFVLRPTSLVSFKCRAKKKIFQWIFFSRKWERKIWASGSRLALENSDIVASSLYHIKATWFAESLINKAAEESHANSIIVMGKLCKLNEKFARSIIRMESSLIFNFYQWF